MRRKQVKFAKGAVGSLAGGAVEAEAMISGKVGLRRPAVVTAGMAAGKVGWMQ